MNLDQARFFMVEQQIRPWDILDPTVLDLIMDTPRHEFVAAEHVELAYCDVELPIGHGEMMMPPRVEAKLLQALDIADSDTVLEIGTGSGYLTALLASMAKSVTTVEIHASLQKTAQTRLTGYDNIHYQVGDGATDWNDNKQYDVIVLTGSVSEVSQAYLNKLNLGGRLFVIYGDAPAMKASVFNRVGQDEWSEEEQFETDIQPLKNSQTTSFSF